MGIRRGVSHLDAGRVGVLMVAGLLLTPGPGRGAGLGAPAGDPQTQPGRPAPKPIPAGPNAPCQRDLQQLILKWNRRTLADAYRQVGRRDPEWDQTAIDFLDMAAMRFAQPGGVPYLKGTPTFPLLVATGKRAIDAGCDDPLVLYEYGVCLFRTGKAARAEPFVRRAIEGFRTVPYPRGRARFAPGCLVSICKKLGAQRLKQVPRWTHLKFDWTIDAARDGSFADGQQRVFYTFLELDLDGLFRRRMKALSAALLAEPKADRWIANMVAGRYHIDAAWDARGGKRADKVTDEGWQGFGDHLRRARTHLTRAWRLHPEYPEAAAYMVTVAMGACSQGESERQWFDRAVAAQFDYMPAYRKLMWALRPRWGGSLGAVQALGVECLNTKRFDTQVPARYYEALKHMDADGVRDVWEADGVYDHLRVLCQGMVADPSRAQTYKDFYRSLHAAAAWRTGRYAVARRLVDRLGRRLKSSPFHRMGAGSSRVAVGEVRAATGPAARRWRQATTWRRQGHLPKAIAAMEDVREASAQDSRAQLYVLGTLVEWRAVQGLATGGWVDLMPAGCFYGWRHLYGSWRVGKDGRVTAKTSRYPKALMLFEHPVGDNFELYGEVEWTAAIQPDSVSGVCLGHSREDIWRCAVLKVDHASGFAGIEARATWRDEARHGKTIKVGRAYTFRVQVWQSRVTAYVNGQPVVVRRKVECEPFRPGTSRIGLGPYLTRKGAGMRIRRFLLRRLDRAPAPASAPTTQTK